MIFCMRSWNKAKYIFYIYSRSRYNIEKKRTRELLFQFEIHARTACTHTHTFTVTYRQLFTQFSLSACVCVAWTHMRVFLCTNLLQSDFFGRFARFLNCFLSSVLLIELVHTLDSLCFYIYFNLTISIFFQRIAISFYLLRNAFQNVFVWMMMMKKKNCKASDIGVCVKIKKMLDVQWRGTNQSADDIIWMVEKRIDLVDGARCVWESKIKQEQQQQKNPLRRIYFMQSNHVPFFLLLLLLCRHRTYTYIYMNIGLVLLLLMFLLFAFRLPFNGYFFFSAALNCCVYVVEIEQHGSLNKAQIQQ